MEFHALSQQLFGFNLHRHLHRHLRDHFIPHEGNNYRPHVLHHRALFLYSVLLVVVKVSALSLPILLPWSDIQSLSITPENIIQLTNESRQNLNLQPLTVNAKLTVAATNKAHDMMSKGYFAHNSPDGVSPWYWITQAGYNYTYAGENLAIRFSTAEGVNEAWLASPAHRANLLSDKFTEIGVGVLTDEFGDSGTATLVVQMFGSRQSSTIASSPEKTPAEAKVDQRAQVVKTASENNFDSPEQPQISYPLNDSFINNKYFKIIGRAGAGTTAKIFIDDKFVTEATTASNYSFVSAVPQSLELTDGAHTIFASVKQAGQEIKTKTVKFNLDFTAPQIFKDKFSITPKSGESNAYIVSAAVSDDSIRTLVTIGRDTTVLARSSTSDWSGEIVLQNPAANSALPIEVFVQDIAGNELKERVGVLENGNVRGIFGVSSDSVPTKFSVLGILNFSNLNKSLNNFYLYFISFLTLALLFRIAIRRHIQHVPTIVASSFVIMLAALLYAL